MEGEGQLVFAPPRYDDVMMMDPEAYAWIETGTPGVSTKLLGTFTERGTRLGFVKVAAGATWNTGSRNAIEVLFLSQGRIAMNGKSYGARTGIELMPGDPAVDITAEEDALFFSITLPKF